jgi:predicted Fe-Mo cluster-binding NifX family protein
MARWHAGCIVEIREVAMRIAVPVSERWVARAFEYAPGFTVAGFRDGFEVERIEVSARAWSYRDRAKVLASMGVKVVLCDEISDSSSRMLAARGIEVQPGRSGTVNAVLGAFCETRLTDHRRSPDMRSTEPKAS